MKHRKQTQHWRRYISGRMTFVNMGIVYKKRPKGIGTAWESKTGNIHGPRVKSPELFKSVYNLPQKWVHERKRHIQNYNIIKKAKLPSSTKVKIGTLKDDGLAIQSFITPKKDWINVSVLPHKRKGSIGKLRPEDQNE